MVVKEMLERLSSRDYREVRRALFELGGDDRSPPDDEVAAKVLGLAVHANPDIRQRAVFDIGIHWALPQSYDPILHMVRGAETDELTMHAAIGGLGILINHGMGDIAEASRALATLALNESVSRELRDHANRVLLIMHGKISAAEYGKSIVHPDVISWDDKWLEDLTR
jgi:hypothetical protein